MPYLTTGILLLLLKFGLDFSIAAHWGHAWSIVNYFLPPRDLTMFTLVGTTRALYLTLWAVAIPFFWVGVSLTLARLRDAGLHATWIVLFFVPVLNLIFFILLSLASSAPQRPPVSKPGVIVQRQVAHIRFAPVLGIAAATLLGLGLVLFSTRVLVQYTWGLFLGVPVAIGFVTSWFLNARVLHTRWQTGVHASPQAFSPASVCLVFASKV